MLGAVKWVQWVGAGKGKWRIMSRKLFGRHRFDLETGPASSTTVVDFRKVLEKRATDAPRRLFSEGASSLGLGARQFVALKPDDLDGDDCEDDVVSASFEAPRRHPFSAIIAKWSSCAVQESQESQHSRGALSEDEESEDDVSDYDSQDSLIDNEELVKVFRRKCRSRSTGGFCVLDEDEEMSSEELSDEIDEDSQSEERSGSKRCSRASHESEKRPRLGPVRTRRGLGWLGDGKAPFKKVKAVTDTIQEKLGENCEKLEEGGELL